MNHNKGYHTIYTIYTPTITDTNVYKLISPVTIMYIIMSDRDLPSHTGRPIPGDCHLSYIHGRLPSST